MTHTKKLGQYFTPPAIAQTLVSQLESPVGKVIEFGVGNGALAVALEEMFPKTKYVGVELDQKALNDFRASAADSHCLISADAFDNSIINSIPELTRADTVIGNPPFINADSSKYARNAISSIFPSLDLPSRKSIRAELYFLAISLQRLDESGQASFILPMSFFTSPKYIGFRNDLVTNFSDIIVMQLPSTVFSRAEVDCCILKFRKMKEKRNQITVCQTNSQGAIIDQMQIPKKQAILRMDYIFNKVKSELRKQSVASGDTLETIGCKIQRGSASKSQLDKIQFSYFHTTSFPESEKEITLGFNEVDNYRHALTDDILIPRVGSRCLDRQVLIQGGQKALTDCVYKINVNPEYIDRVMKTLSSDFGRLWRHANASGKCAKFLTHSAILNMPVLS